MLRDRIQIYVVYDSLVSILLSCALYNQLNRNRTPKRISGPEITQPSPSLETRCNNAKVMKRIAPTHSHRHAMANEITMMYVGIRWISRAIIVSPKP